MTKDEGYSILLDTVTNNKRHVDFDRVGELSDEYQLLITGKGIEKKLKRFNPREDEAMFEQRCRLTIPITPAVVSSIKKAFYKVPRTQPVSKKIMAKKDSFNEAVSEIEDRVKNFYGSENNIGGLDYYFQNRFVDLSFKDPNAWVIVEFDPFDPKIEKASPRPFEASCKEAINFYIRNNIVQWLIVQTAITYKEKIDGAEVSKTGKKFTLYGDNIAVTFTETAKEDAARVLDVQGEQIIDIEKVGSFIVNTFETKTRKVPAFRVGYMLDSETDGRTFVSPLHDALCYFEKSIKQGSEYDLSTCLHTFPQKIVRITKSCPGDGAQRCDRGKLTDGTTCGTCKGTGRPIHTSGQDVVEVAMPESKDDLIQLSDFVYYVPLPIELLKLQKQWVDELKVDCHQAIFNSSVLLRKSSNSGDGTNPIDVTATEKDHDMESVYDTLSPFGEKVSNAWVTIVELISIITDNADKVTIIHRFPANFKLKSRLDLYNEIKVLKDTGAPPYAIDNVDNELAEDIFADDADGLLKYRVKRDHYPFTGKTPEEVSMLLNSPTVLKKTKVLWNYFDEIFTDLEREATKGGSDFYILPYEERKVKIDERVAALIAEIDAENQTAVRFSMVGNETPAAVDKEDKAA